MVVGGRGWRWEESRGRRWSVMAAELRLSELGISGCHAPLPKIRGNRVATKVGDVYAQGIYLTYTR